MDVAMNYEDKEFETFMMKVDKIGSIITGLTSNDQAENDEALKEATIYLEGKIKGDINDGSSVVKHSRTVINQEALICETPNRHSTSKEAFMVLMSKDAERRARDRKEREERAYTYSKEANKCFCLKDFISALHFYNKAIDQHVNQPMLYAERAKVLLKLQMHTKAVEDCEKGLKLNEDLFLLKGETYTPEEKKENDLTDEELKFIRNQIINKSTEEYQSQ
ncbi:hypothetical protein J437_LFUL014266 [Ladona fulva]|uniref:Tetratricopeptide repeat protein 12 n=1 Tax=Ladona fulva TaxID=123851 RepID=A0A8K0P654_LADFU|nr:hypothetical protein J437_LFUL014266 [Ladona fulva]